MAWLVAATCSCDFAARGQAAAAAFSIDSSGGPKDFVDARAEWTRLSKAGEHVDGLSRAMHQLERMSGDERRYDDSMRREMAILALTSLKHIAAAEGANETYDRLASELHDRMETLRGGDREHADTAIAYATYWTESSRPGIGLPYLLTAAQLHERVGATFMLIADYQGVSVCLAQMGRHEEALNAERKAKRLAESYFVEPGVRPSRDDEWMQYVSFIEQWMERAAQPGEGDELWRLWEKLRPIDERYYPKPTLYLSPLTPAELLAAAGDGERAERLIVLAEKVAQRFAKPGEFESDLTCRRATVTHLLGKSAAALPHFERCHALMRAKRARPDPGLEFRYGEALEATGKFAEAVAAYRNSLVRLEEVRSSFELRDRTTFFETPAAERYWAVTRSLARLAAQETGAARRTRVVAGLRSVDGFKARQLTELTGRSGAGSDLELEEALTPQEALLVYVMTKRELIVLGITRDAEVAALVPLPNDLRRNLRALSGNLASPTKPRAELERDVVRLSAPFLEPVASLVREKQRLIVVPDGELALLPFDLLSLATDSYVPVHERHEVSLVPALAFLGSRNRGMGTGFWGLGDPVYSARAPAAILRGSQPKQVDASRIREYFAPLPETRREVEAIARLFPGEHRIVLGKEATETSVQQANLAQYKFLHFATHGVVGNDLPNLSEPALILSEEQGHDGYLTSTEVEQLRLQADLTVLSACKTGDGEIVTGEGVLGMGRAFLTAGSKSVLVSLWSVDSAATEALMVRFYEHLRRGERPAQALRGAKAELRQDSGDTSAQRQLVFKPTSGSGAAAEVSRADWQHPFYWAAFTLFGRP
jgi:CHAT domain-containing protein